MIDFFQSLHIASWVYWTLTVAYAITIVSIVGVVLSENRNPLKSLAWITVLLLFPAGGIILYIFFGRSIKNKRMISRRNRKRLTQAFPTALSTET
ncbi:MAG: PLDc N-terminal domain-containing protein, partial [Paramuribaculum sp.]|nr:PLDc N-terminal domain-containing protein [Paramuribaculum sp.]